MYNYRKEDVLPLSTITLEGESFSAPARVQSALEGVYGSLEAGAKCECGTFGTLPRCFFFLRADL